MSRDVLSPDNAGVLDQFACHNVLVAFDYDGTLAPIVATPDQAQMRESTRERFRRVSDAFPTAVISGRAQKDIDERLDGFSVLLVSGNHGIEPWAARKAYRKRCADWSAALLCHLREMPGVWVEDKQFSIAVHYRHATDPAAARRAIIGATASFAEARIVPGKRVINVMPRGAPHKGAALEMARTALGCDAAIYVGDDETDEDVFAMQPDWPLLTVRVGTRQASRARFQLQTQRRVDDLLELLAVFRLRPASQAVNRH
jgi:trehalose 6-phosphate phosphatase